MRWAIATILLAVLAACAKPPLPHRDGMFAFQDDLDRYDSATAIYQRFDCSKLMPDHTAHVVQAHVRLTEPQLSAILQATEDADFYRLPRNVVGADDDPEGGIMPCSTYELSIASGGRHNLVAWMCGYGEPAFAPKRITSLVLLIRNTLQSKPEVRALPKSQCMRL